MLSSPSAPVSLQLILDESARALHKGAERGHDVVMLPSQFTVVLRGDAHRAVEQRESFYTEQIGKRLDAEVGRLRTAAVKTSWWRVLVQRVMKRKDTPPLKYRVGAGNDPWEIAFYEDVTSELEGDVAFRIYPDMRLRAGTRELTGNATSVRSERPSPPNRTHLRTPEARLAAGRPLARLWYTDDDGQHRLTIGSASSGRLIKIGRIEDESDFRDVPIRVDGDVSRDHARLRYVAEEGRFEISDVSTYGTTVDGSPIVASDDAAGPFRWHPLPQRAEIGLAGAVTITFRQVSPESSMGKDPKEGGPATSPLDQ